MKIFAQTLIAALLLSTVTLASTATRVPTVPTKPTTTNSFKAAVFPSSTPGKLNVFVGREPGKPITVRLKDEKGELLAEQPVSKNKGSFRFQFDLSALEDGTYKVEIVSGNDVTIQPVTLSTKPVESATRTISLN
ncbi:hypothetical protein [Spirosoma radiotolerans]|uniref:Secretion system C-terminal sorting domain-containing protein n=1 Tax=Spirosoma radiotolerans TaxID=1379870 RepID=A0A0E3VA13_9BACT|nr:hypothetical protein [Spirosoma radiotolerans]AKD57686.1 hypothetical protein SD10_25130 [Spirosoma radiotolerans]